MSPDTVQQTPYETLAGIYDYVMRHVDYDHWAAYLDSILQRFDHHPRNLVDLACGTGNITAELSRLDYQVAGVDSSASMIRVAREKASSIPFFQGDLRQLSSVGPFEAAVCVYDSFNYLLTPEDIKKSFETIFRILLPQSLFIFDVCTEQNSLRYFNDVRDNDEGPGFSYERHSYYERTSKLQYNHFLIRFEAREEVLEEIHTQRIYPWKELIELIEASPFELLEAFDGFTFKKGSARSDRIHFVLRHPGQET